MTPFHLIELARRARSVEELVAFAERDKIKLSCEDAQIYFERWHEGGELSDDELEAVGGGAEDRAAGQVVCEFCLSGNLLIDVSGGYYCNKCSRHCWGKRLN